MFPFVPKYVLIQHLAIFWKYSCCVSFSCGPVIWVKYHVKFKTHLNKADHYTVGPHTNEAEEAFELQQWHKRRQTRRSPRQSSLLLWRMLRWKVGCNNLLQSSSAILYCLYNKRKSGWDLRLTQGALLEPPKQLLTYITDGQRRLKSSKDLTCLGTSPKWRPPFTSFAFSSFSETQFAFV